MLFRTQGPVMVLAYQDNHEAAVNIPAGETIRVLGPDRDDRFSVIRYHQQDFLVFESDLHRLCEAVSGGGEALPEPSGASVEANLVTRI